MKKQFFEQGLSIEELESRFEMSAAFMDPPTEEPPTDEIPDDEGSKKCCSPCCKDVTIIVKPEA